MSTVLVLEDNLSNLQCFRAMLWSAGYNVLEATTGTEAIQVGSRNEKGVDLLLSDVAVPERSGTEVALELSASHPSMAVLFVSGTPVDGWESTDRENLRRLRPDRLEVLEKPVLPSMLLEKVRKLLKSGLQPSNIKSAA